MSLSNDTLGLLKRHHPTPLRVSEIRQRLAFVGHPKSVGVALQRLQKNGNVRRTGRLWQYVSDPGARVGPVPGSMDAGIAPFVEVLVSNGIETFESCEGGAGHAFPEPTIRFHGSAWAGFKAFSVAMEHGLPVLAVRLAYHEQDGQLAGPHWEMVFRQTAASVGRSGDRQDRADGLGPKDEHAVAATSGETPTPGSMPAIVGGE